MTERETDESVRKIEKEMTQKKSVPISLPHVSDIFMYVCVHVCECTKDDRFLANVQK
jgi:hypothetical protein